MEISFRLKTIAEMVKYRTVADIGTDHGYIPIYMAMNDMADRVIACDVNEGPLKKANENIEKYGLGNKIESRLGSGLEPVAKAEVETAVIAGMGGMLITTLLGKDLELTKSIKQLVLSPHLDLYETRKYLHRIGFMIEKEAMLKDEGKFYTVISAVAGNEKYALDQDYLFGKYNLDNKNLVLKEYLGYKLKKLELIKASLADAKTENSLSKIKETEKEILLYKEALKTYEV